MGAYITNLAINIANAIHTRRNEYFIKILANNTSIEFITGDQPVINTINPESTPVPHKLELFYPIAPTLAIIFGNINQSHSNQIDIFEDTEIEKFNNLVYKNSHEQIYSSKEKFLVNYIAKLKT